MPASKNLEAKKDFVIQEYQGGKSFMALSKELGVSEGTVRNFLKKYVQLRENARAPKDYSDKYDQIRKLHSQGFSGYKMAPMLGIPERTMFRLIERLGLDLTHNSKHREDPIKNHADEIVRRYENGETERAIAEHFDCHDSSVSRLLRKNGVKTR